MSRNGYKVNAASQFLREIDHRRLTIVTNVEVEALLYANPNSTTIVGIEFRDTLTNATYHASSIREVLLADGAIRNAQLLMQSGVGPAEHLRRLDVRLFFFITNGNMFLFLRLVSFVIYRSALDSPIVFAYVCMSIYVRN